MIIDVNFENPNVNLDVNDVFEVEFIAVSGGGGGGDCPIEIVKVNGVALVPDEDKAVDVIVPQELFPVTVTLGNDMTGTADKAATEIQTAAQSGKLPVVLLTYNGVKMVAPLTFVGGEVLTARFTYIDQNTGTRFPYAHIDIVGNSATLTAKSGLFAMASDIVEYSAGEGISITNGVISVSYANGDTQSF